MPELMTLTDRELGQKVQEEEDKHNRAHHAISELFRRYNKRIAELEERITALEDRPKE